MTTQTNTLVSALIENFDEHPRVSSQDIIPPSTTNCLEAKAVEAFFSNKTWREIDLRQLQNKYHCDESACLYFMSDAAARYYLPGYLRISLEHFMASDCLPEYTMSILTVKHDRTFIFDQYSAAQKQVIAQCLDCFAQWFGDDPFNEALDALESYWVEYL